MDLIVPLLARVMNIYLAGQVYIVLMFALIISGTLALNRALTGRWSALPLFAFPLLYNYVFLVGLMNYIFGIGVALWALAGWVAVRERIWPIRIALSTACVVLLFFCHLSALGIYGIGVLSVEILRLWERRQQPWPLLIVDSSPAACRSWPPHRCYMPARPCNWCPASTGTSAARSTG